MFKQRKTNNEEAGGYQPKHRGPSPVVYNRFDAEFDGRIRVEMSEAKCTGVQFSVDTPPAHLTTCPKHKPDLYSSSPRPGSLFGARHKVVQP